MSIQSKLLRVLQEKEIERLGAKRSVKVDFRLIAASNVSLENLVKKERFRQDLLYRLNTILIKIPPLRERKEDIPVYSRHFVREINESLVAGVHDISDEALKLLMVYDWPGNVRELANVIEQSVFNVTAGHVILPENLPRYISVPERGKREVISDFELKAILQKAEKDAIENALHFVRGNKRKVAKLLGDSTNLAIVRLKEVWHSVLISFISFAYGS